MQHQQQQLFNCGNYTVNQIKQPKKTKCSKKRIRYKIPTYKKFYSLWLYDREQFRQELNITLKGYLCAIPKTQDEILERCFVRDEQGKKQRDCDEKHIFRYKTMQNVYMKLFDFTGILPIPMPGPTPENKKMMKNGLLIYPTECQAEILNTWQLSLEKRLKIHLRLLLCLKRGLSVLQALKEIKKDGANNIYQQYRRKILERLIKNAKRV